MPSFELYYTELLRYTKNLLKRYYSNFSAEDFINDAFVALYDQDASIQQYKDCIFSNIQAEIRTNKAFVNIDNADTQVGKIDLTQVCTCCHESLPLAAFRIIKPTEKNPTTYLRSQCKSCENKKRTERVKLNGYKKHTRKKKPNKVVEVLEDLPNEMWFKLDECKGYFVSNLGRFKDEHNHEKRGCISGAGYLQISLKGKKYLAHRLVAKYFVDNPCNLPEVNHDNGDKKDNRAVNLKWSTKRDNILHMYHVLHKGRVKKKKPEHLKKTNDQEHMRMLWRRANEKRKLKNAA